MPSWRPSRSWKAMKSREPSTANITRARSGSTKATPTPPTAIRYPNPDGKSVGHRACPDGRGAPLSVRPHVIDHLGSLRPIGTASALSLVAQAVTLGASAQAMVRAGYSVHRDARTRIVFFADHSRLREYRQRAVADATLCRVRLRRARNGV